MDPSTRTTPGETLLFACAGAAHCGRVAYQAALLLTGESNQHVFCTAAVSGGVQDKVDRTRAASRRVAIDGCEDHCVRKTLELAGMPPEVHLVLTELGIEKRPACASVLSDAQTIARHARGVLAPPEG